MSQKLIVLRLVEASQGHLPLEMHCWGDEGWRPVLLDEAFVRAFNPDCIISEPAENALELNFAPDARALLLLPGNWVWSGVEEIPRAARRQSNAVGYMVEDQLAEDVEQLHFICQPIQQDMCSILAISCDKMDLLTAQLARLDWPVVMAAPEYQLLAMLDTELSVWLDGEFAHIWLASGHGLTLRRQLLGAVLDTMVLQGSGEHTDADSTEVPAIKQVQLLGILDEMELADLQSRFSNVLNVNQCSVEAQLLASFQASRLTNLLCGEYNMALDQREDHWWRKPAIALAVCFITQLIFFISAGSYYQWRASTADSEARALFAELFPGQKPSADLRRQLNSYLNQSSGDSGSLSGQLHSLSEVWGDNKELKLQSLRYDDKRGELLLQLRAANLTQLDGLVGELSKSAYKAELLGANELNKGVSGSIRLR